MIWAILLVILAALIFVPSHVLARVFPMLVGGIISLVFCLMVTSALTAVWLSWFGKEDVQAVLIVSLILAIIATRYVIAFARSGGWEAYLKRRRTPARYAKIDYISPKRPFFAPGGIKRVVLFMFIVAFFAIGHALIYPPISHLVDSLWPRN